MPCERFELEGRDGEKVTGIICTRSGPRKRCACGEWASRLCDFPLRGDRRGRTCSKPLCAGCTSRHGENDLCGPHAKMAREAGAPAELLADPNPGTMGVVADLCEERGVPPPPAATATSSRRTSRPPADPARPGDGAAALRELERTLAQDETGTFAGAWTRRRGDCLDTEAVDFVLARDESFRPRDLEDWKEYCAERAAIFEYLGGRPRAAAEMMARQLAGPAPRHAKSGPLFAGAR